MSHQSSVAAPFVTGDVFAAVGSGEVFHYDKDGNFIETLNTTLSGFTTGMAFDAAGQLYVTNFSANAVTVFDTNGVRTGTFGSGYATPESIVFDLAGNVYVGNLGNGIRKYDSTGTFQGTVIDTRVDFFDLSADQSTFVFGQEGNVVRTVSNAIPGVAGADFATGLAQAFAMRFLPTGGLLVADRNDIKSFDATGALIDTYDAAGFDFWFALNLDPDGTSFWSGDVTSGVLSKFDIATGNVIQSISTGRGGNLFGVAVFGEITVGGPPTGVIPEPSTYGLAAIGLLLLSARFVRTRSAR